MTEHQQPIDLSKMDGNYPLVHTEACKMLAAAIDKAKDEKGWSQRTVAKLLDYRTSVSISHMAAGRVPIPIDRALDFARLLGMDAGQFLIAVIEQRYPELNVRQALAGVPRGTQRARGNDSMLVTELESIAGCPLDELPLPTINVLREAVAERNASRRWMNIGEIAIIERLRALKPAGLTPAEVRKLFDAVDDL